MPELDLLTEIHTDVKHMRKTLDDHIMRDEGITKEYILPMWEKYQQDKGAISQRGFVRSAIGYSLNALIAAVTAIAAVKGVIK